MFKRFFVAIMVMILMVSMTSYAKESKLNGEKLLEVVKEEMKECDDGNLKYTLYESKKDSILPVVRINVDADNGYYIHYYFYNDRVSVYMYEAKTFARVDFDNSVIDEQFYDNLYKGRINFLEIIINNV